MRIKNRRRLKTKDLIIKEQLQIFAGAIIGYLMDNQDLMIKEIGIDKKKSLHDQ